MKTTFKFEKNTIHDLYWIIKNNECIGFININWDFYNSRNYYTVNDKIFPKLNDAKRYIRENF